MKYEILDCSLRDGGYINNWNFGQDNIQKIITCLEESNIEFLEVGYLKKITYCPEYSIFPSFDELNNFNFEDKTKICLMMNFGEFSIDDFSQFKNSSFAVRLAFKKKDAKEALKFAKIISELGFAVSLNPMNTIQYSDCELKQLCCNVNEINIGTFAIVDSIGNMNVEKSLHLFKLLDSELKEDIRIGYHSHNSLKSSFLNVVELLKSNSDRILVIDTSLMGIGRGAGNLPTEDLMKYLNLNYSKNYSLKSLDDIHLKNLKNVSEFIKNKEHVAYRLAAIYDCHPNYAKLCIENNFTENKIINLFKNISMKDKDIFNPESLLKN